MAYSAASPDGRTLAVNQPLTDEELNELFAASWPDHTPTRFAPLLRRASVWVSARRGPRLIGFVKVVDDGGAHAFLLDTTVHPAERRNGVGRELVAVAAREARRQGMSWLHVDYEERLTPFYTGCGFRPTAAGLLRL